MSNRDESVVVHLAFFGCAVVIGASVWAVGIAVAAWIASTVWQAVAP